MPFGPAPLRLPLNMTAEETMNQIQESARTKLEDLSDKAPTKNELRVRSNVKAGMKPGHGTCTNSGMCPEHDASE